MVGVDPGGFQLGFAAAAADHAHLAGRADQAAGFPALDGADLGLGAFPLLRLHIEDLTARHAPGTGVCREDADAGQSPVCGQGAFGENAEGVGQQAVAREDRKGFAVDPVVGRLAPAVVVVVHRGQIVVDEAVGVDHLNGELRRAGGLRVAAAGRAEPGGQKRTEPLSPGVQAVGHGLEQAALGLVRIGVQGGKCPFKLRVMVAPDLIQRLHGQRAPP